MTKTKKPSRAEISLVMAAMGRKGGKIGGKNRMEQLGAKGRSKLGTLAVRARWKKYRANKKEQS